MDLVVREARHDDLDSISEWTRDTFEWGDYIAERFPGWVDDPDSFAIVCVDPSDVPIAVSHAQMVSETEGWLEGARVHPDHKRSGLGTAMNIAGVDWATTRGARVVRLAVETDNAAADNQVRKLGYRPGSAWVTGFFEVEQAPRTPPGYRLSASGSIDVDSAWMFWSTSELAASSRGLLCEGWQWRKAKSDDLRSAATTSGLLQSQYGWVMFRPGARDVETMWLAAAPQDFPGLVDGIIDHAWHLGRQRLVIKVPAADWTIEALRRSGFEVKPVTVFYLATG